LALAGFEDREGCRRLRDAISIASGLKALVDELREKGFTANISICPGKASVMSEQNRSAFVNVSIGWPK
jgi:hypothetical protein